jgi:Protein of unknown function (DUF3108)
MRFFLLATVLTASSATGCQFLFPTPLDQEADTRPSGAVHVVGDGFLPGERLKTEITLDGVVAGVGELKVGARCLLPGGRTALPVTTTGRSAGIVKMLQSSTSEVTTLVDGETSRPIEGTWDVRLGQKRTVIDEVFGEGTFRFKQLREAPEKPSRTSFGATNVPTEDVPHDAHTSMGFLRHWHPEPGARGNVYAVYGRYVWRADVTFRGPETITTALGETRAVRIDGVATKLLGKQLRPSTLTPRRPFSMWISDDSRRVPLRVLVETALAKVSLDVVGYERDPAVSEAAAVPCVTRVDAKAIQAGIDKRRKKAKAQDDPDAKIEEPKGENPNEDDDEKDEREDREALEKLLKR